MPGPKSQVTKRRIFKPILPLHSEEAHSTAAYDRGGPAIRLSQLSDDSPLTLSSLEDNEETKQPDSRLFDVTVNSQIQGY